MKFYRILSYVFHPVLYPLVSIFLALHILPYFFPEGTVKYIYLTAFIGGVVFPLFSMWIFKANGMISSFLLPEIRERKYPFLLFIFLSYLLGRLYVRVTGNPDVALYFYSGSMGIFILFELLLFNIKASMHTLAIGTSLGYFLVISAEYRINMLGIFTVLVLLFAVVGYARYRLGAHSIAEVITGFVVGLLSPLVTFVLLFWL